MEKSDLEYQDEFAQLVYKKKASRSKLESDVEDAELALAKAAKKLRDKRLALESRTAELESLEALTKQYRESLERLDELSVIAQENIENNRWDEASMTWASSPEEAAERESLNRFVYGTALARARKIYYNR